jgi:hypothetical protein
VADAPQGLTFSADERRLFLFLMGQEPPEAVPQEVYGLAEPFHTLDHDLASLPEHYVDVAAKIDGALPDEAVAQFKAMMADLLGTNGGVSHIDEIRSAARLMGEQVEGWSRSLLSAQVQILSTLIALEIQLDIMAAMAFFTGGATAGEEALLQAEARLTLSVIMDHLLALLKFVLPTAIQATIGALIMMVASLVSSALGGGDPQKPGINWEWVGEGALGGALADIGIRGIGGFFDAAIGDALKSLDNKYITELTNIGGDFVKMGGGSAIAATFTEGLTTGQWHFAPMMFVGGGIGGAAMSGFARGVHVNVAKYRMMKINPDAFRELTDDLSSISSGKGDDLGGSGHVTDRAPDPRPPGPTDTVAPPPVRQPAAFTRPPDVGLTFRSPSPHMPEPEETLDDVPVARTDLDDPFEEAVARPPFTEGVLRDDIPPSLDSSLSGLPPVLEETGLSSLEPLPSPPARPLYDPALRQNSSLSANPPVHPETLVTTGTVENAVPRPLTRTTSGEPPEIAARTASGTPSGTGSRTTPAPPRRESGSPAGSIQRDRAPESANDYDRTGGRSEYMSAQSVLTESGKARRAYVEDVPDEGLPPDETSPEPRPLATPGSEGTVTEALADVRATAEERDKAYLDFERRLAAHPDHGVDASERVVSLREWFADQWTGEPAERSDLGRRLAQRLEAARAVTDADRAFDREVVSSAPKTRGREHAGFLSGSRVAALREEFVRAMTDPGLTADARTGRVEEFRREYARAGQERRDLTSPEGARLTESVRREAVRLSAEAKPIAELGHRFEEVAVRRAPSPDWAPEVRSWYRNEQAALAERTVALLRGRRFDAELRTRLESDLSRRLDALHDVADRRNLAHQEFSRLTAGQKIDDATLRSPAAVEWAARRIDALREEYVQERSRRRDAAGARVGVRGRACTDSKLAVWGLNWGFSQEAMRLCDTR